MQPIAIDKSVFEEIFSDWENRKADFLKLALKLQDFHSIIASKNGEFISSWEQLTTELKDKFNSSGIHQFIDDLLKPGHIKYEITDLPNKIENHIENTPDKLALSDVLTKKEKKWNIYSSKEFVSEDYKPSNILFRIISVR